MDEKKVSWLKDLISTLGFPVVVAGWLLYERWTMLSANSATLAKLTETISRNTEVVQQLIVKMGGN